MHVINLKDITGNKCNCDSWLDHWAKFGGDKYATLCGEKSCTNSAEVGAHVQSVDIDDNEWYIVPLCKEHNALVGALEIDVPLAPVNVSKTCGQ